MEFFQVLFPQVSSVMQTVSQNQQMASGVLDTIKGFIPKILDAWTGDDATAFSNHVTQNLVPAMLELIAAIAGVNLNLGKGQDIVNQADQQIGQLADQIGDVFNSIF